MALTPPAPGAPPATWFTAGHAAQISIFVTVLMMWSNTELAIELVLKREQGWSTKEACIICGPLGAGAKTALLHSMLGEKAHMVAFCEAVRTFQNMIGRNALAHGFVTFKDLNDPWFVVYREVKNGLTVKTKALTRYFEDEVMQAFDLVMSTGGFSDSDLHEYSLEIAALAQDK